MKINFVFTILLSSVALLGCKSIDHIIPYAPTETYPDDDKLATIEEKRAMVIVAHDDDMCMTAGTISKLNKDGWNIRVLSLPQAPERNQAHIKACSFILDSVLFFDMPRDAHRRDLDTVERAYDPIPREQFNTIYDTKTLAEQIINEVYEFSPSIIFTLDNEIGGYGHPDHVMISQLVVDLAKAKFIQPQYIYQNVYTDHMENSIMKRHAERLQSWGLPNNGWERSKEVYGVSGMPEPTVQVNIFSEAKEKMSYLKSYNEREQKTIGFFVPLFYDYKAEDYFGVFDREFYRVISFD
jgi:LmbE family N-acetylglucosaminyl deacetylase